jgi:hypothetical protein
MRCIKTRDFIIAVARKIFSNELNNKNIPKIFFGMFLPAKLIKFGSGSMIAQRSADVGDCILRQIVNIHPANLVAFLGLSVDGVTDPGTDVYKEIDAFIAFQAVHHTRVVDILWFKLDPNLLLCLTLRGSDDRFSAIQMPGRNAVLSISKAGVEAADQQDLVLAKEKQMDSGGKCGAFSHKIKQSASIADSPQ